MRKKKSKIDSSKKILIVSYIVAIALTSFMCVGTVLEIDVSPIREICMLSWGEVTASNIWYYKKAKKENTIKLLNNLPEELRALVDINSIINNE